MSGSHIVRNNILTLHLPAKAQLLFVAPEHGRFLGDAGLAEHEVQVHHLILALITDDHVERSMADLDAVLHQRADT